MSTHNLFPMLVLLAMVVVATSPTVGGTLVRAAVLATLAAAGVLDYNVEAIVTMAEQAHW